MTIMNDHLTLLRSKATLARGAGNDREADAIDAVLAMTDTTHTRLTKDQAAIIGAFTGIACGPFGDIHEYAEKVLGRPVWTHEFASPAVSAQIREASRADFIAICHEEDRA